MIDLLLYCIYIYNITAPVMTYLMEQYKNDIAGYNVTQTVHVEAGWPGDPVGETR